MNAKAAIQLGVTILHYIYLPLVCSDCKVSEKYLQTSLKIFDEKIKRIICTWFVDIKISSLLKQLMHPGRKNNNIGNNHHFDGSFIKNLAKRMQTNDH